MPRVQNLYQIFKLSSTFICEHDLNIKNYTKKKALNDGQIVGEGSHKDLLRTCPTYLEIAQSQLSKEELEA